MPLAGLRQYSTATGALRKNPSLDYSSGSQYLDQNFKLMFIYPIMFEEKTSKFQATRGEKFEPYENIIRDFLSASFLKEVFVSNAIDVVSMASQIRPLRDEVGDQIDTTNVVGDYMSGQTEIQRRYIDQGYRMDIEHHLRNKVTMLKRLFSVDPQIAPLNPQIDMILLQNLVEVPVITGTKPFKISAIELFSVLVASIVLNRPLNSTQNIESIFNELQKTSDKDFYTILNNLTPADPNQKKDFLERLRNWRLVPKPRPRVIRPTSDIIIPDVAQHEASAALHFLKKRLSMARLDFKTMVDPGQLRRRVGIDVATGQMAGVVTRVNPERNAILSEFETKVIQDFSTVGNMALRSFANIYHPQGSDIDYIKEHRAFLANIHAEISDTIRGDLYACIEQSLGQQSHESMLQHTKTIKNICSTNITSVKRKYDSFVVKLRAEGTAITSTAFDIPNYTRFLSTFEDIASASTGLRTSIESSFDELLDCGNAFNHIRSVIDKAIMKFFDKYFQLIDDINSPAMIKSVIQADPRGYDSTPYHKDKIKDYILQARRSLNEFYLFIFFRRLQRAFCKMVDILDVEVKTAQADVTEWPNYTLVVPIEMLSALNAALNAKSWRNLVGKEFSPEGSARTQQTSESFVKGLIKFLGPKLGVPNLIVVDRNKKTIYTKLMHQSQVIKMNLNVLNTFVKEMENIRAQHAL